MYCPVAAFKVKLPLVGGVVIENTGDVKFKSLLATFPLTVVLTMVLLKSFTAVGVQTPMVREVLRTALQELPETDSVTVYRPAIVAVAAAMVGLLIAELNEPGPDHK